MKKLIDISENDLKLIKKHAFESDLPVKSFLDKQISLIAKNTPYEQLLKRYTDLENKLITLNK